MAVGFGRIARGSWGCEAGRVTARTRSPARNLAKRSGCVLGVDAATGDRQAILVAPESPFLARVQFNAMVGPFEFHRFRCRDYFLTKGPILAQIPSGAGWKELCRPVSNDWRIRVVMIPVMPVAVQSQWANGERVATAQRDGDRLVGSRVREEIKRAPVKPISALLDTGTLDDGLISGELHDTHAALRDCRLPQAFDGVGVNRREDLRWNPDRCEHNPQKDAFARLAYAYILRPRELRQFYLRARASTQTRVPFRKAHILIGDPEDLPLFASPILEC